MPPVQARRPTQYGRNDSGPLSEPSRKLSALGSDRRPIADSVTRGPARPPGPEHRESDRTGSEPESDARPGAGTVRAARTRPAGLGIIRGTGFI
eukprot:171211-Hanusia_phi.AAC.2